MTAYAWQYWLLHVWLGMRLFPNMSAHTQEDLEGPRIISEPPSRVDFANSSGVHLTCDVTGRPKPTVTWLRKDGSPVVDVPRLRQIFSNGTLLLYPFRAEDYRQDIHTATYRCLAKSIVGSVISRNIQTRGVVKQFFKVQVYDEFVINGNLAVLRCHVPSFIKDYVTVKSWYIGDTITENRNYGGHYRISALGELYINDVNSRDGEKTYHCKIRHVLTGEEVLSSSGRLIVTDPKSSVAPRIHNSVGILKARHGDVIEMPCAAQALPRPKNRWFRINGKDNILIESNARYIIQNGVLIINGVEISDNGKYICVVNNNLGEERADTTLTVTASLTAHIQPKEKIVDVGKPATFVCVISGFPVTSISWAKNGNLLMPSASFHFPSREILQIPSIRREDKGMYQCFAENEDEIVQATAELRLGDATPVFHQVFSEVTMEPGPSVSLECVASGNPPPNFEWTLDGMSITKSRRVSVDEYVTAVGDVISNMNISKSKIEDGGEYKCIAHNKIGRVEHAARLNIYGIPYIRPMPNISVVAGMDIFLPCRTAGYPIHSVVWERGGLTLPINLRQRVHPNGTLVIKNAERTSDEGFYTCMTRNENGQQSKENVWTAVMEPPKIGAFNFPRDLSETMRVRVLCNVVKGDLPIHISWIKDGFSIPMELGVQVQQADDFSSSLTFRSITAKHRGNYTCIARNSVATANYTADLLVYVAPYWTIAPRDVHVKQGNKAVISCQADGFPAPNTTWMKENLGGEYSIIDSRSFKYSIASNGSLLLEDAVKEQDGNYLCQASNGIGSGLSKVVSLTVNVPVYFPMKNRTHSVKRKSEARLTCDPKGDLPIQIEWKMKNQPIRQIANSRYRIEEKPVNNGFISELIISESEREDGVPFSCLAKNEYGREESFIQLTIQESPLPPTDLKLSDQGSRFVVLSWKPSHDGNSPISHYRIQYKEASGTWDNDVREVQTPGKENSAKVIDLSAGVTYSFLVIAENEVGESGPSNSLQVTLGEEAPGGPPIALQVKVTSSKALKITWKPPKKTLWNGNLLGYYVGYKIYESTDPYIYKTVPMSANKEEELLVDNLKKHTKYSVVVQAYNRMGNGPYSDEIVAHTYEDVPDKPPLGLQCSPVSSQSLLVTWEPPPTNSHNGIIQGYKVLYLPVKEDFGKQQRQFTTTVLMLRTNLDGLEKFQNYSIRVLAYTGVGDGNVSEPVFCRTLEDVPGAPAEIKALAMSSDAILVTWLPPKQPNGVITKYTVYIRSAGISSEHATRNVASTVNLLFEARGLLEKRLYEFWVTASSDTGEGESTRVVSQAPKSSVAAQIASFSSAITTAWKRSVELACRSVGIPAPKRVWKFGSQIIESSNRYDIRPSGTLIVQDVRNDDSGNYSCEVENIYGNDKIYFRLTVYAPPEAPGLSILMVNYTSVVLKFTPKNDGGNKVIGYSLSYKRELGEWEEVQISTDKLTYALENLNCGSRYQMYVTAINSVGTGEPGPIVKANTKGAAPKNPSMESVLKVNSTFVILLLGDWPDQGCPVLYFVVQYSLKETLEWILVSNNIQPSEKQIFISGLLSTTWYILHVVAHNDAGSTVTNYQFSTLTKDGESAGPPKVLGTSPSRDPFYRDLNFMIPVLASLSMVCGAILVVCLLVRRRKNREGTNRLENAQYPAAHKNMIVSNDGRKFASEKAAMQAQTQFQMLQDGTRLINPSELFQSNRNLHRSLDSISAYHDDICPYATVSLSDCRNNKPAQDFHLHVFRHQNSDDLLEQKVKRDSTAIDTYARVRKKTAYSLHNNELQLQDAPCDSQVEMQKCNECNDSPPCFQNSEDRLVSSYPLPRLRRQSMEYDSVLSDSDTTDIGVTYYTESASQLHDRSRVPDLIYHADSSTSNEMSPDDEHIEQRNYTTRRVSREKWWQPESEAGECLNDIRHERSNALHGLPINNYPLLPPDQYTNDFLASVQFLTPSETSTLLKRKSKHVPIGTMDKHFMEGCNLPL